MIKISPNKRVGAHRAPLPTDRRRPLVPFAALLRPEGRPHALLRPEGRPPHPDPRLPGRLESRTKLGEQEDPPQLSPSVAAEDGPAKEQRCSLDDDLRLDPMARHLANPVGMPTIAPNAEPVSGLQERMELARTQTLEQLFPALVRKAAWQIAPDRRSATLRLEIGSGSFDGTTVLIRADLHEVHIELDAPPGIDLEVWKSRLRLRLASQGLIAMIS